MSIFTKNKVNEITTRLGIDGKAATTPEHSGYHILVKNHPVGYFRIRHDRHRLTFELFNVPKIVKINKLVSDKTAPIYREEFEYPKHLKYLFIVDEIADTPEKVAKLEKEADLFKTYFEQTFVPLMESMSTIENAYIKFLKYYNSLDANTKMMYSFLASTMKALLGQDDYFLAREIVKLYELPHLLDSKFRKMINKGLEEYLTHIDTVYEKNKGKFPLPDVPKTIWATSKAEALEHTLLEIWKGKIKEYEGYIHNMKIHENSEMWVDSIKERKKQIKEQEQINNELKEIIAYCRLHPTATSDEVREKFDVVKDTKNYSYKNGIDSWLRYSEDSEIIYNKALANLNMDG